MPRLRSLSVVLVLLFGLRLGWSPAVAEPGTPLATSSLDAPCSTATPPAPSSFPLTETDDLGRAVALAARPERIVSLAPSNTEILFALGAADRVVGVDAASDFPPEVAEKPDVGDYVAPDPERVVAVEPDLVLASGLHAETVVPALEALDLTVAVIDPPNLEATLASIERVGRMTGTPGAAEVACRLRERVAVVEATVAGAPEPRVFFELSPDLYTAGPDSFVDDLIARAGGANVAADADQPWPQLSAEAVVAADPEVIILADHEAGVDAAAVAARPGWSLLAAVEAGRVVEIEPDLALRPGPRVVDGLEEIARALHPDRFPDA